MTKDEIVGFARSVVELDGSACGEIVRSLMLSRKLTKVVRALDKLSGDRDHRDLARRTLNKLGFDTV